MEFEDSQSDVETIDLLDDFHPHRKSRRIIRQIDFGGHCNWHPRERYVRPKELRDINPISEIEFRRQLEKKEDIARNRMLAGKTEWTWRKNGRPVFGFKGSNSSRPMSCGRPPTVPTQMVKLPSYWRPTCPNSKP